MVVQVYAPTEDSSVMVKDDFFRSYKRHLMIVMGDFKVRVGNDTNI